MGGCTNTNWNILKMEYTKKTIEQMRIKLNSGDYSSTWVKTHLRDMMSFIDKVLDEEGQAKDIHGNRQEVGLHSRPCPIPTQQTDT